MEFISKQKRKHGDRNDGHYMKDAPIINKLTIGLWGERADCEVCSTTKFDITNLVNYINNKQEIDSNYKGKVFHFFLAAITRTLNERRKLNIFIKNRKFYMRDEIRISFVAKRGFSDKAEEAVICYIAKPEDNVNKISNYVIGQVKDARDEKEQLKEKNSKNSAESLEKLPNWIFKIVCWVIRKLDKRGKVPESIKIEDPSFSTVLVANLGSIGGGAIYHHLNNYGNNSIMITIGSIERKEIVDENGNKTVKHYVDVSAVIDERIADGFYFLKSIKLLEKYLKNPEVLEKNFNEDVVLQN